MNLMNNKYLTVSAISRYLKHKFDVDDNLRTVYLKGEISNYKAHTTGHIYFSIKDETSKINAIMFKSNAVKLNFNPKEGTKVLVKGAISVYEATGSYQIYVTEMEEDGIGNLYIEYQKLKNKLSKEGLFDKKYKKQIPKIPKKIGIVTAKTGAAIKDILSTIERRYPLCETYLFPCLVQGDNAAVSITNKIIEANKWDLDVLIVGRGGGSFEDLNPYNDESLARTIFASEIPIISAVGHEIDFTIADFVSDLRAPTPTAAAELAVPNIIDIKSKLNQYKIRVNEAILNKINYIKLYLDSVKNSFVIKNPKMMFENKKQDLDLLVQKADNLIKEKVKNLKIKLDKIESNYLLNNPQVLYINKQNELEKLREKLVLVNPLDILKRGYNLTFKNGKMIKTRENIKIKDKLQVRFYDGQIEVEVTKTEEKNGKKEI